MSSSFKGDNKTPCARLCHIVKWEDFDGYGFNLHAEKGKNGQYIGKVDEGSPSQAAGLKQGDRIVEVNEINIANETHKQVVERIKAFPNETKLLVVDHEADEYFRANNIIVKGSMANVKVIKTPERNPNTVEHEERSEQGAASANENARKSIGSNNTVNSDVTPPTTTTTITGDSAILTATTTATTTTTSSSSSASSENGETTAARENGNASTRSETLSSSSGAAAAGHVHGIATGNGNAGGGEPRQGLNLKMSAKELRAQLAARKKYDPKKESIGFKDKFDIVQKL